jgi:rare lipoprotein A
MDGNPTRKAAAAAALALLALGGAIGPALAESDAGLAATPVADAAADLPRFVPSAEPEAGFADAFAPFDDPSIVAAPPVADDHPGTAISGGVASWYGPGFAGRKTASGERFDPHQMTAAHRTLPFGSKVRVTHNGRSVVVRINDRGPFHGNRIIDLSQAAAEELGLRRAGSGPVELALLEG